MIEIRTSAPEPKAQLKSDKTTAQQAVVDFQKMLTAAGLTSLGASSAGTASKQPEKTASPSQKSESSRQQSGKKTDKAVQTDASADSDQPLQPETAAEAGAQAALAAGMVLVPVVIQPDVPTVPATAVDTGETQAVGVVQQSLTAATIQTVTESAAPLQTQSVQPMQTAPVTQAAKDSTDQQTQAQSHTEHAPLIQVLAQPQAQSPETRREQTATVPLESLQIKPAQQEEKQLRFDQKLSQAVKELEPTAPKTETAPLHPVTENKLETSVAPEDKVLDIPLKKQEIQEGLVTIEADSELNTETIVTEQVRTAPEAPATSDPEIQVRERILTELSQDRMEFQMQLNPRELGTVGVKMVLENGKLAVEITAGSLKAYSALQKNSEALTAALGSVYRDVEATTTVTLTQGKDGHMEGQFDMNSRAGSQQEQQSGTRHSFSGSVISEQSDSGTESLPQQSTLLNYMV
ncbi:flagellar hook-length control protein FliK [Oscillospiraceae bacterium MB08-C2-2]|nr:flagellar hook-length control protein FliK [Oscillospiraceae bacterium MB08-C2-2]